MEKHNFLYKNAYIYSNIHSFENYIKLEGKKGLSKKSYSRNDIIEIIAKYGKSLYEIFKQDSFKTEISTENKKNMQDIFIDYYKVIGYMKNSSKDTVVGNYEVVFVNYDTIVDLKNKFIQFYLLYSLYNMLDLIPLKSTQLKKVNEYMKILKEDYTDLTINNSDSLYNLVLDLISKQFCCTLKIRLELVNNEFITFNVISSDIYALCLYAFSDTLALNELHKT